MRALLLLLGCFGHSIERPDPFTVIENLGGNQYSYRSTKLQSATRRGPAAPLGFAPAGSSELGLIDVTANFGGWGPDGLRTTESEFHPRLAEIAGSMGGTHFLVLRTARHANALGDFITSLTVDVLVVP
jgi:hypothetical protein